MSIERAALWLSAAAFALAFAVSLRAQISLEATPEPMIVTNDIPVKTIGLWALRVCNDGAVPRSDIFEERIYMAKWRTKETDQPSGVGFLTAAHAKRVLEVQQGKNKKQIAVELIGIGLDVTVPLLAWDVVSASKKVIGAAAAGGSVARIVQGRLQSKATSIALFTEELLTGPFALAPLACVTKTVFASRMKNPQTVIARIP